jgi:hypothetical protein
MKPRRWFVLTATAVVLVSCGPQGSGTPAASAVPSGAYIVATTSTVQYGELDAIEILGLNGTIYAKQSFQPRTRPYIGNAAVPLQAVAQVVGGAVYYIDGYGAVRELLPSGAVRLVATFPQQPQQHETWFAVSHDRTQVIAGVLAFPAIGPAPSGVPWPSLVGDWKFDLEASKASSPAIVLKHMESPKHPDDPAAGWKPIFPVGWTAAGPTAMVPLYVGTQNAWFGGALYTLDADGNQTVRLGGSDCISDRINAIGFIPCVSDMTVTVRDMAGGVVWSPTLQGLSVMQLSPDGRGISDGQSVETMAGVVQMPQGFVVQGWLDDSTVVGRVADPTSNSPGHLAWIRLSDPLNIHDLGMNADFIGRVSPI